MQWAYDKPIVMQIKETFYGLGDAIVKNGILWGYFKTFQNMMQSHERIPKKIVEKYGNSICFIVNTNQYLMEVVEPRTSWIMPIGYEVEAQILDAYAQVSLRKLVDTSKEIFRTYK